MAVFETYKYSMLCTASTSSYEIKVWLMLSDFILQRPTVAKEESRVLFAHNVSSSFNEEVSNVSILVC